MNVTNSKGQCRIILTSERWGHIVESHLELNGYGDKGLDTIADPEVIIKGHEGELLAVKRAFYENYFVVVYKEEECSGFVVTAFITSKIERVKKRGVIWQKSL